MLAGVYGATLAYWFSDSSEGHSATWTFLGNRIDNVMQIEKFVVGPRSNGHRIRWIFSILCAATLIRERWR